MSKNKIIKGRWYNINKKIKKRLIARYHKIKDWKMDPKGYFLIGIDKKKKIIQVGYCKFTKLGTPPINDMVAIVKGKTTVDTLDWKGQAKKDGMEMGDIITEFKVENLDRPNKAIIYPFALIVLFGFGYLNYSRKKL